MTLALRYAALSHVGLLRTGNEDSAYAGPRLLAVADGMGGHAAGEVASAVAIASIATLDEDAPGADLLTALRTAATDANDHLRDMVAGDEALEGMGTTLTTLLFTGNRLGVLHIGDSRCYLLRDGTLRQITHDDTLVQTLVDEGRISEEEAGHHPQRSVITRALDGRGDVDFDTSVREVRAGDRYLLCTDGLTGPVARRETLQEALELADPQDAVERLVQLALRGGGPDNVTVIVADVVDGDESGVPAVAGAAADAPQSAPAHLASGSAGRAPAAAASTATQTTAPMPAVRPAAAAPTPSAPAMRPGRGRLQRIGVTGALLLSLVVVGLCAGWAYVRSQWFVGADSGHVSVYRGLSSGLAGVDLATVQERSDLDTSRLSQLDREGVERGIRADDRGHARRIVQALQERSAVCPPGTGPPAPAATSPTLLGATGPAATSPPALAPTAGTATTGAQAAGTAACAVPLPSSTSSPPP